MIPPIATPPTAIAVPPLQSSASIAQTAPNKVQKYHSNRVLISSSTNPVPLTSPDLKAAPAPNQLAQSELPGGSTPPAPPAPNAPADPNTTTDTGSGYPSRIPTRYIGPVINFGNGTTSFGVVSRFPFAENFSLRPSLAFGSGNTTIRVPITYDFALGDKEPFERNPLITFNAGAGVQYNSANGNSQFGILGTIGLDVNVLESVALVASFNTDFSSNNSGNVGLGFEF